MVLIGLSGAKRSGKSYVAQALENKFSRDMKVLSLAFADGLKETVYPSFLTAMNMNYDNGKMTEMFIGDSYKEDESLFIEDAHKNKIINMRQILQKTGTDFIRERLGLADFWVAYMEKRVLHKPFKYSEFSLKGREQEFAEILGLKMGEKYKIKDVQSGISVKFDAEKFVRGVINDLESLKFNEFMRDKHDLYILTDVRFDKELNFVKDNGGTVYRIHRREPDGSNYEINDAHASENVSSEFLSKVVNVANRIGTKDAVMRIADDVFEQTLVRNAKRPCVSPAVNVSNEIGVA